MSDFKSAFGEIIPFNFWGEPVYIDKNGVPQCPGFFGDLYAKNRWDYVIIGGVKTPGICEVHARKFRDVDKKKQKGSDGQRITVHGIEPALVEIRITIWTPEQLNALEVMWTRLFPGPQKITTTKEVPVDKAPKTVTTVIGIDHSSGQAVPITQTVATTGTKKIRDTSVKTPLTPYDVTHPELDFHKIKSLYFVEGEGPSPGNVVRSRIFSIRAVEFLQPGNVDSSTTPSSSVGPQRTAFSKPDYATPGSNPSNSGPG